MMNDELYATLYLGLDLDGWAGQYSQLKKKPSVYYTCMLLLMLCLPFCSMRTNHQRWPSHLHSYIRPRVENDYPLNLSILISGGKETNRDSLSKGD